MSRNDIHVAILQNFLISEKGGERMIENISKLVLCSNPNTKISVYAPIQGDAFPNQDDYDLIILTGGPFNLLEDEKPSWVNETLNFIKSITTGRIGVETIPLTSGGATFFNARSLDIHKNHLLVVDDIGPHLSCLALNNEILLSKDNQVLTFQGHPELDAILSQLFVDVNNPSYFDRNELKRVLKPIDAPHDGEIIFVSIMKWASEDINFN
ncbi:class I glutamine amidotransferase-like protein [Penicillium taxi]|uniref:class I glutamine amidotransferase-like protein n=1 Tax=Penicillium taxi TaxID=168475 RepID=UPI0025457061|nr:class I glutamine amidotransferase-like protein [Penicillium taxi]KAJ5900125.1 class I glutamine amidotransferase-like protein [Penicillium taxi]